MNANDPQAMVETRDSQTLNYLNALNIFILCYAYTLGPHIYCTFVTTFIISFMGTSNVIIFASQIIAAISCPIIYIFVRNDYVMLNTMTYFPYPDVSAEYYILGDVILAWTVFIVSYAMQFIVAKKM